MDKTMKRVWMSGLAAAAGLLLAGVATAAEPAPQTEPAVDNAPAMLDNAVNLLHDRLSLSDEQAKQVRTILDEAVQETRKQLEQGGGLPTLMSAVQAQRKATDEKILAVLTEEQKATYATNKEVWRQEGVRKKMMEEMTKQFALTDAQRPQIEKIVADSQKQVLEVRTKNENRPLLAISAIRKITEESDAKIVAVLNETQRAEYEKAKQNRQEQIRARLDGQW